MTLSRKFREWMLGQSRTTGRLEKVAWVGESLLFDVVR